MAVTIVQKYPGVGVKEDPGVGTYAICRTGATTK